MLTVYIMTVVLLSAYFVSLFINKESTMLDYLITAGFALMPILNTVALIWLLIELGIVVGGEE